MERFKVKILIRVFRDGGEPIALMPEIPGTNDPGTMTSYMVVGQHGAADEGIVRITRKPKAADEGAVARLRRDLKAAGYIVEPVYRLSRKMRETRRKLLG